MSKVDDLEEKLLKLKRLYDDGAISLEAYERLRKEYEEAFGKEFREHIEKYRDEAKTHKRKILALFIIVILIVGCISYNIGTLAAPTRTITITIISTTTHTIISTRETRITVEQPITHTVTATLTIFPQITKEGVRGHKIIVFDDIGDNIKDYETAPPAPPYLDLVSASVTQIDVAHLELEIEVNGWIAEERPGHLASAEYFWLLDLDRNPATGVFHFEPFIETYISRIGIDAIVIVGVSLRDGITEWSKPFICFKPDICSGLSSFSITGNTITLTISLDDIEKMYGARPSSFNWIVAAIGKFLDTYKDIGGAYYDKLPNNEYETFYCHT